MMNYINQMLKKGAVGVRAAECPAGPQSTNRTSLPLIPQPPRVTLVEEGRPAPAYPSVYVAAGPEPPSSGNVVSRRNHPSPFYSVETNYL